MQGLEPVGWGTLTPRHGFLSGLGFTDPATLATEVSSIIEWGKQEWEDIQAALGIGAGRREADVIVPMQNQITNTVLVPAVDMGTHSEQHTCTELLQMQGAITNAAAQFNHFLDNTVWQDGRAADQARFWLSGPLPATVTNPSWFHQVQSDFAGEVYSAGCGSGVFGSNVGLGPLLFIGAGLALIAFTPRRRSAKG